ncbi:elongation factor G [bacterium CG17_big_fil_post_rev_8_21_14_2_50_64_8]|nr:MAG: elongation factor G [bacterium CG17_big_fil_post_rev_8_21_14_2_50_64_8]PJA75707.1 MAG: elongation factor G [bacterium CG_4_9_14_3_um_filter_65_15]
MKTYPMEKIRNIALVGPHGVGKTSLADAMMHVTGAVGRKGSVDDGSSVFDYLEEEVERKQTLSASLAWTEFDGNKINIIDTPGVDDFRGDTISAMRVVEGLLFVVKADGGFEVASENLWNRVRRTHLPTFIVVNRLSKDQANWRETLNGLKDRVGGSAPLQLPIGVGEEFKGVIDLIAMKAFRFDGQAAIEMEIPADMSDAVEEAREMLTDAAANADDVLTEKFLEELTLSDEDIIAGLKKGTMEGTVFPIFFTDAVSEAGVTSLLRSVANLVPSPASLLGREIQGHEPGEDTEAAFTPGESEPVVALAFKRQYEAQGGDVTWLRVFSGSFKAGDTLECSDGRNSERMGQLSVTVGRTRDKIDIASCGDIILAAKLKNTQTGTTLASGTAFAFAPFDYSVPTSADAINPVTSGDEDKMAAGLNKIREEDPTFQLIHQPHLSQTLLATQGEIHTNFILDKLKKQTGVEVERHRPRINFKETIRGTAEKQGRHKKQTGGRGQFGDVHLRMEPMPRGEGFEFVDGIVGGVVPNKFIPAVEKGARETLLDGLVAGYEMVDVKVTLFFGSYHNVDSSEAAFKAATRKALKAAVTEEAAQLRPVILEPIMKVNIVVPQAYMGDVMGDISTRRGAIQGSDAEGSYQVVTANIPEDELYQYATSLRSVTQGTGTFTMEFSHYAEVPGDVQKRLVEEYSKTQTAED